MKNKWRMPHPATMFLLLTMAVVFLSWICDIYGLKVTLPQTGEDIRVQSLLSPEGIRWWLRNAIKNFTGFAPFDFDVHAMIFSDDAPRLEAALHNAFADRKLNFVNQRREFFRVSLDEIKKVVKENYDRSVEFVELAPAEQYRKSIKLREEAQKAKQGTQG